MSRTNQLLQMLGVDTPEEAFRRSWGLHLPSSTRSVEGRVTMSRQDFVRRNRPSFERNFQGFAAAQIGAQVAAREGRLETFLSALPAHQKAIVTGAGIGNAGSIGGNTANGVVPLVFDPDILRILKD